MKHTDARAILVLTAAVLTWLLAPAPAVAGETCDDEVETVIPITINKPTNLNIQHYGQWLVIHADIYYDEVDPKEPCKVYLNWDEDTPEANGFNCFTKADDRGYLICKVNIRELDQLAGEIDRFNTFTLKGTLKSSDEDEQNEEKERFCGETEVKIIDRGPEPSPRGKGGN